MYEHLVRNTMVGESESRVMPGLVRETKPAKAVGTLEGVIRRTMPEPKTNSRTIPSGKAPATRVTKTHFGSVQYPGAHS